MTDNALAGIIAIGDRRAGRQAPIDLERHNLAEGDVVQLKSGGPKMTVDGVSDEAGRLRVKCSWFNGAIRMSDLFEFHSLRNLEDRVTQGLTVSRMLDLDLDA